MNAFDRLTAALGRLPGVGRRSAERMGLALVRDREGLLTELGAALRDVSENLRACSRCGSITPREEDPCRLCTSPRRDGSMLCVVEDPNDIILLERSGEFNGRYHALMGKISPMSGDGPRDIRLKELLERVEREGIREVVLALSTDMEGDATASFVGELLRKRNIKVTRLAFGLPAGSGIGYSDPVTLGRALKGRQDV